MFLLRGRSYRCLAAQVLQHLKYIDEQETVLLKGRVACEVTSSEALLVTELIFQNVLSVCGTSLAECHRYTQCGPQRYLRLIRSVAAGSEPRRVCQSTFVLGLPGKGEI